MTSKFAKQEVSMLQGDSAVYRTERVNYFEKV